LVGLVDEIFHGNAPIATAGSRTLETLTKGWEILGEKRGCVFHWIAELSPH